MHPKEPRPDQKEDTVATTSHVVILDVAICTDDTCLPSDHESGQGDQGDAVEEDRLRTQDPARPHDCQAEQPIGHGVQYDSGFLPGIIKSVLQAGEREWQAQPGAHLSAVIQACCKESVQ